MAAPRFCTLVTKSVSSQAWSHFCITRSPETVACLTSGYCVDEWLPQMNTPETSETVAPPLIAIIEVARLWSRRVS